MKNYQFISVLLLFFNAPNDLTTRSHAPNVYEMCSFYTKMFSGMNNQTTVIETKLINLDNSIKNVINGSIIEYENNYLMIFRHDTRKKMCKDCKLTQSEIKMVMLDKQFNQKSNIQDITSPRSFCPEDPRIHTCNSELIITYNDEPIPHMHNNERSKWLSRRLFTGKLDPISATLSNINQVPDANLDLTYREKNWAPFEFQEATHFIYAVDPYTIIKAQDLNNQESGSLCPTLPTNIYDLWDENLWGPIYGGTPARLVDDTYIAFFHSWNLSPDKKNFYYVMGAYTFEPKPPFKILSITPHPIFFQEIFTATHHEENKHIIYPTGFVIEKKENQTILHVSCGENDTSTRIVSINKDRLLDEMIPLLNPHDQSITKHLKLLENKSCKHNIDGIDFIYMINLDQRPEKYALSTKQLTPYNIYPYRVSAINGWELPSEIVNNIGITYDNSMKTSFWGKTYSLEKKELCNEIMEKEKTYLSTGMRPGPIGCIISHLSVLYDAYKSGYKRIWIMEDDINVEQDPHIFSSLIKELDQLVGKDQWDILFTDNDFTNASGYYTSCTDFAERPEIIFPYTKDVPPPEAISPNFCKIKARYGTHSMIIQRAAIKKILDYFNQYKIFWPYDIDLFLIKHMNFYSLTEDIVSNIADAPSDSRNPEYLQNQPL